jgi:hypothetical protein
MEVFISIIANGKGERWPQSVTEVERERGSSMRH